MSHPRVLAAFLVLGPSAAAQVAQTWTLPLDRSPLGAYTHAAIVDATGASTVAGSATTSGFGGVTYTDGSIARVDPQGALLWHRTRNFPGAQTTTYVDVAEGPAGSVYACGVVRESATEGDLVLSRYAADGTELWTVRHETGRFEAATGVATDSNGDAWVVGVVSSSTPIATSDVLLLRVTSAGAIAASGVWSTSWDSFERGAAIVPDGQGGAYVAGQTGVGTFATSALLLRIDAQCAGVWARLMSSESGDLTECTDVALNAAGDVYVTGRFAHTGFVSQPFLARYDANGNQAWQRGIAEVGHLAGIGNRIVVDAHGDAVVVGRYGPGTANSDDAFVCKVNPSGFNVWQRTWAGTGGQDEATALAVDAGGEIAVAGRSCPAGQAAVTDALALRYDRDGRLLWSRTFGTRSQVDVGVGIGFGPPGAVVYAASVFDGQLDALVVRFDDSSVPFCFGDGSGSACPCSNATPTFERAGCSNSLGVGGRLTADGSASLANDTLTLRGGGMPNASALYFQGTTQTSAVFGDGLRCAGGTSTRLKTLVNASGASQYPGVGDASVSVRGSVASPGTRTYQVWYRNAAAFCTPSTFNLTNGVLVTWTN